MATYTTNYNLKKPADSDFINIADLNGNADIIDEELKKRPVVDSDGKLPDNLLPDLSETYEEKGAANKAVNAHNTNTNAHNDIRIELGKKAPEPIIGTAPPTASTVGVVGQQYIDKTNKRVWYCTAAEATGYTWISPDKELADAIATKQNASTAVNTSNIGSQTVNKAKYATDTIAVGTPALRNQYFVSAEATPTVNGQIAWVYG
nr:MAG TPA: hypothetical protein [Caudoviricetes sp.]